MLVCARLLEDMGEFGLFQAIMGLYGLVIAVGSPLNLATVHSVGGCPEESRDRVQGTMLQLAAIVGLAGAGVALLLSPALSVAMHVGSVWPFFCVSCLLFISPVLTTLYGGLHARNLYGKFAYLKTAESLLILLLGTLLMVAGFGVSGAVLGYALAMVTATAFLVMRPGFLCIRKPWPLVGEVLRSSGRPLLVSVVLLIVVNCPMLIARCRLSEDCSGCYGTVFSMRNLVFPFAFAVAVPLYSRTIGEEREHGILGKTVLWVCILGAGFIGIGLGLPELFITTLYGSQYREASPYMCWYGFYLLLHMVSMVLMFYLSARGCLRPLLLVLPVAITLSLVFLPVLTVAIIIRVQVVSWCAYLVALLLWTLLEKHVGRESVN